MVPCEDGYARRAQLSNSVIGRVFDEGGLRQLQLTPFARPSPTFPIPSGLCPARDAQNPFTIIYSGIRAKPGHN